MTRRHFIVAKVGSGFIVVDVDEHRKNVSFKTFGNDITVRDLMENDRVYRAFIKYCYGYTDPDMVKTIQLDSYVTDHRNLTVPVVSALVQEYYDEKIIDEQKARYSDNTDTI